MINVLKAFSGMIALTCLPSTVALLALLPSPSSTLYAARVLDATPFLDAKLADAGIQVAINVAKERGAAVVQLPAGRFVLNRYLFLHSGLTLRGMGENKTSLVFTDAPRQLQITAHNAETGTISVAGDVAGLRPGATVTLFPRGTGTHSSQLRFAQVKSVRGEVIELEPHTAYAGRPEAKPYADWGRTTRLAAPAKQGDTTLRVADASVCKPGYALTLRGVGDEWDYHYNVITAVEGDTLRLERPLAVTPEPDALVHLAFAVITAVAQRDIGVEQLAIEGIARTDHVAAWRGFQLSGIHFSRCENVAVRRVTIRRWNGDGFSIQGGRNVTVEDCSALDGVGHGFHPGTGLRDARFMRIRSEGNGGDGLYYCWHNERVNVLDSILRDNGEHGVGGLGIPGDRECVVSGNTIERNGKAGIEIRGGPNSKNVIRKNTIRDNSRASPGEWAGVHLSANYSQGASGYHIEDNTIESTATPATQRVGIEERHVAPQERFRAKADAATGLMLADNNHIVKNTLRGHATADIVTRGPRTVVGEAQGKVVRGKAKLEAPAPGLQEPQSKPAPADSRKPSANAAPREKRDRGWLEEFLTRPLPDTPRNRRYLALMNAALDETYLGVDVAWFATSRNKEYHSRVQSNALGRLAFCQRTPGLKYHRDPKALEILRAAYRGVVKNVAEDGKFTWENKMNSYGYEGEQHEHAWRLEPLLLGYLWVGEQFPSEERREIEAALRRAADWLFRHPKTETNNRGAVWCAVLTMCGLYFERPEYLALVEQSADRIIGGVVLEDGECGEHTKQYGGGGPDSNYTYTGWGYVYLYWLLAGRTDLDARMLQASRWLALYNTFSGCPLVSGASVRRSYVCPDHLQDVLPAFERFSHTEPLFGALAGAVLTKKEKFFPAFGGHITSPLLWAILERGTASTAAAPDWYATHTQLYERPEVHYALVHRQYHTGVVFRGRTKAGYNFPLRGVQTFAFGDEWPLVLHSDATHSTTQADGVDTATMDVEKSAAGWEVVATHPPGTQLATIAERRKTLWALHAYTPVSAVIVFGGAKGPVTSRWMVNRSYGVSPVLDSAAHRLTAGGLKATLTYLTGVAKLVDVPAVLPKKADQNMRLDPMSALEVTAAAPLSAFGFSDGSFRFGVHAVASQTLTFTDASGSYHLALADIVGADGNLNRAPLMRLTRQEAR
jgi:parallel beta-helix repeat protein